MSCFGLPFPNSMLVMNAGPDDKTLVEAKHIEGAVIQRKGRDRAHLSSVHSAPLRGLCTPCSRCAAPDWDRAPRCYWAAAPRDAPGPSLKPGRPRHSRSNSSSRSRRSPELDVVGERGYDRAPQWGSWKLDPTATLVGLV